jgi:hypothetical protein
MVIKKALDKLGLSTKLMTNYLVANVIAVVTVNAPIVASATVGPSTATYRVSVVPAVNSLMPETVLVACKDWIKTSISACVMSVLAQERT